ncbi:hypothetical protein [Acidiphilium acidophilum]|uniref:hypothetical protein n=1 Tax=Acidiphilium acidophilum TaxID=76588 RepID=UPI002E8E6A5C|nr:hypothetical protein [Acidiphilium acidophilum]
MVILVVPPMARAQQPQPGVTTQVKGFIRIDREAAVAVKCGVRPATWSALIFGSVRCRLYQIVGSRWGWDRKDLDPVALQKFEQIGNRLEKARQTAMKTEHCGYPDQTQHDLKKLDFFARERGWSGH